MGRSSAQERDWPVFPEQRQRKAVRSLEGRTCDPGPPRAPSEPWPDPPECAFPRASHGAPPPWTPWTTTAMNYPVAKWMVPHPLRGRVWGSKKTGWLPSHWKT